jgi:DnaK suppressor protein
MSSGGVPSKAPVRVVVDAMGGDYAPREIVKGAVQALQYSDEELEYFREIILKKRDEAEQEMESLQNSLRESMENASDESAYSFHMADAGTDAQEREKTYMLFNRTRKFNRYLDDALQRIDNKTYGVCKVTGKPIQKERLMAVPHTEISIEAKLKQK